MLKKVAIGAVVVFGVLAVVIATRPDTFRVARSRTIGAAPPVVFANLADFHRWDAWSPWGKLDPAMKAAFTGEPGAVGSTYSWVGNSKVGEGRMTVLEAKPERLVIELAFLKPFASTSNAIFTLAPAGAGTDVTWAMEGKMGFLEKGMCLVMSMDKMIGPDFERGLTQLAQVSQAQAPAAIPAVAH